MAIAAATVVSLVLGGLWFTMLFGKAYAATLGRPHVPQAKPAAIFLIGPFVCGFMTTLASAVLIRALQIQSVGDALAFGAVVGFGYLASTTVNTAIKPNMPRPLFYGPVRGSYFLLAGYADACSGMACRMAPDTKNTYFGSFGLQVRKFLVKNACRPRAMWLCSY